MIGRERAMLFLWHKKCEGVMGFLSKLDSPHEHLKKVLENNREILGCLKERTFEKVSLAMRNHLVYVGERLKSVISRTLE